MGETWTGRIATMTGPKYQRIARAIEEAVREGDLAPGDQLPPQRDLAEHLEVTVGTVARAYQIAGDEGWIDSHVGRGTFVVGRARGAAIRTGLVDLTMNQPVDQPVRERVLRELRARTRERDAADLLLYHRGEAPADAEAAAAWLSRSGRQVAPDEVVVTAGGQHGLFLSLLALCRPGDTVVTETFISPGIRTAADAQGLRLVGVRGDAEGLDPDHLREVVRDTGARVACFTPVIPNPTALTWSPERLGAVAAVVEEEGLRVVEDDVYRGLHEAPPASLHSRTPGIVIVSSVSKALTPGLRVGAVAGPEAVIGRIRARAAASMLMVPPLLASAASALINADDLEDVLAGHRERVARRHEAARDTLPHAWIRSPARGLHLWLSAPPPWTGGAFVDALRRRGVLVTQGRAFAVDPEQGEDALRVSLGGHLPEEDFRLALETLVAVAGAPPQAAGPVV